MQSCQQRLQMKTAALQKLAVKFSQEIAAAALADAKDPSLNGLHSHTVRAQYAAAQSALQKIPAHLFYTHKPRIDPHRLARHMPNLLNTAA